MTKKRQMICDEECFDTRADTQTHTESELSDACGTSTKSDIIDFRNHKVNK